MTASRRYDDPCGVARALDRVGERWALLVVRELLLGPKRFTDLKDGLPGASPNVLSQRLDELLEAGVVQQRQLDPPARTWVYELTPWGRELEPVLLALAQWGSRATPVPRGDLSPDALLLALRTTLDRARATTPIAIDLWLDRDRYRVHIERGEIEVTRAPGTDADATIETDATTLRRLVFGDLALTDARAKGSITIEGNARAAARFLDSFRRPAPARPAE